MLTIHTGPMASGKTTALWGPTPGAERFFVGRPVRSHNPDMPPVSAWHVTWAEYVEMLPELYDYARVAVLFDEVQFAPQYVIQHILLTSKRPNFHFICAMLDKDSDGKTWQNFIMLEKHADELVYHRGTCGVCGAKSTHTRLKTSIAGNETAVLEGDLDIYMPVCWECFMQAAVNHNLPPDPYK